MLVHKNLSLNDCDLKFAQVDGQFSGYCSVFSVKDSQNDIIMPGAYADVLKAAPRVPVYVNHGWLNGELPIGMWNDLKEDDHGLFGESSLVMQMSSAIDAYWSMKSGLVDGLSVAILPDKAATKFNDDGSRSIHRVQELREISIATYPSNDQSRVTSVKFADALAEVETIRDFERLLRDVGAFDRAAAKSLTAKARELFAQRDAGEDEARQKAEADITSAFLIAARGLSIPR